VTRDEGKDLWDLAAYRRRLAELPAVGEYARAKSLPEKRPFGEIVDAKKAIVCAAPPASAQIVPSPPEIRPDKS